MVINSTYILIAFAISLVFSLIGTPLVVKLCNTYGIFDLPNSRKVHKYSIPRLGGTLFMPSLGLGVVVTLLIGFTAIAHLFELPVMLPGFALWLAILMVVYSVLAHVLKRVYIKVNKEWV